MSLIFSLLPGILIIAPRRRSPVLPRRGATATEVALILSILLAGMLMGFAELGNRTNQALSQLTGDAGSAGAGFLPALASTPLPPQDPTSFSLSGRLLPATRVETIR